MYKNFRVPPWDIPPNVLARQMKYVCFTVPYLKSFYTSLNIYVYIEFLCRMYFIKRVTCSH